MHSPNFQIFAIRLILSQNSHIAPIYLFFFIKKKLGAIYEVWDKIGQIAKKLELWGG
jgi:hypothetical protein